MLVLALKAFASDLHKFFYLFGFRFSGFSAVRENLENLGNSTFFKKSGKT